MTLTRLAITAAERWTGRSNTCPSATRCVSSSRPTNPSPANASAWRCTSKPRPLISSELLAVGGAEVAITGCNPLSTHDDVSAALDAVDGITSYAERGVDDEEYYEAIEAVIGHKPTITVDDGMDLVAAIHEDYPELIDTIIGGAEETTTGVHRLRAMDDDGELDYPVFAVNDTPMKRLFDNVHGTGESSLASIAMTTNLSWAGKTVVVSGYGDCGKGVAKKPADRTPTSSSPKSNPVARSKRTWRATT